MADFSALSKLEVPAEKTSELLLDEITVNGKSPTLHLASATDLNKPYFAALLKKSAATAKAVKSGKITQSMIEESRDDDLELFPKFVLKGWDDVCDMSTGADVKFTKEEGAAFLEALPDWLFDKVRNHASDQSNYVDAIDIEINAKNSASG